MIGVVVVVLFNTVESFKKFILFIGLFVIDDENKVTAKKNVLKYIFHRENR